jgi:hypothetical protein
MLCCNNFKKHYVHTQYEVVDFSYVHSLISSGATHLIVVLSSNYTIIIIIIIILMTNLGPRDSCRNIFKELKILPLQSQYLFSLLLFVVKNKEIFKTNFEIYSINTRHISDLHLRLLNLTKSQVFTFQGLKCLIVYHNALKTNLMI